MIRSAGGVVSERRFSGVDTTPNREQLLWTVMNSLKDEGVDITTEDITSVPNHYIYELSKYMTPEEIALKYGTTVEKVQQKIKEHIDLMFEFEKEIEKAKKDLNEKSKLFNGIEVV